MCVSVLGRWVVGWVGGQMSRLGVQVNDLTKLTGKLDSVPTEAQVS